MNKALKTITIPILSFLFLCSLTSCKDGSNNKESEKQKPEYGYNTEYIELEQTSTLNHSIVVEDKFYYKIRTSSSDTALMLQSFDISSQDHVTTYAKYDYSQYEGIDIPFFYPNVDGSITYIEFIMDSKSQETDDISLNKLPPDELITEEYLQKLNINLEKVGITFQEISHLTVSETVALYKQLTDADTDKNSGTKLALITVDSEGNKVVSKDFTSLLKDIYHIYILYTAYDSENIYLYSEIIETEDANISYAMIIINTVSMEAEIINLDTELAGMVCLQNGTVTAVARDEELPVMIWDKEKKKFIVEEDSSIAADLNGIYLYPAGNNLFYYSNGDALYQYDISKKASEKLFRLIDYNIIGNSICDICYIDENHLYIMTHDYGFSEQEIIINKFTKVKTEDIIPKTELILACFSSNSDIEDSIIRFNKTSSDYKIIIKEYNSEDSDYDSVLDFHNDLLSENGPDLIDLTSFDYKQYAEIGLFENLFVYIENDEEFSKKNLNQNILKLFTYNDELFALPCTYKIDALASEKNLLGDSPLTIEAFAEIVKKNPDKEIFRYTSREFVFKTLFLYNEDFFVDYKNKSCRFLDGTFEQILQTADYFPSDAELKKLNTNDNYESIEQKVSEGKQLFYQFELDILLQYQLADYLFQGNSNITGYPSAKGDALAVHIPSNLFAINKNSKYKEECWRFIKTLFERNTFGSGLSVDNDCLEAYLLEKSTPNMMEDENGTMVEIPNRVNMIDFTVDLYALTDNQVKAIRELASSDMMLVPEEDNSEIYNIVKEEAEAFFQGKKTSEEVCAVIQSRVNIFLSENK